MKRHVMDDPNLSCQDSDNNKSPSEQGSFTFPITPSLFEEFINSNKTFSFLEFMQLANTQQSGGAQGGLQLGGLHNALRVQGGGGLQNAQIAQGGGLQGRLPNGIQPITPGLGQTGLPFQTGNGDIENRALQPLNNSNNNSVGVEEPPTPQPQESRMCPGCESYFEVNSPEFDLHVRRNHRIARGLYAYNYFARKHKTMKISDKVVKPKKMSCSGCGIVYKDAEGLKKCLVRHKLEKEANKENGKRGEFGPKKTPSNTSIPTEKLRCEVEGCKDKNGFANMKTFLKHQRKVHQMYRSDMDNKKEDNPLWTCQFCQKSYSNNTNLLRHVRMCLQRNSDSTENLPVPLHPEGQQTASPPLVSHPAAANEDEDITNQIEASTVQKDGQQAEDPDDCITLSQSSTEGMILQFN